MITVSYPITINGVVNGVVTTNIDMSSFTRMKTNDEHYPTMFTNIINSNNVFLFDSINEGLVGSPLSEYTSPEDLKLITDNFTNSKSKIL